MSIDEFYKLVTGDENAFMDLCVNLPSLIEEVIDTFENLDIPNDTVFDELKNNSRGKSFEMALYMLGFNSYLGFKDFG